MPEHDSERHQHKGVQCDLTDSTAEVAIYTHTEQPLVGVAEPEFPSVGVAEPEFPPVGVEDACSDNNNNYDTLNPSINWVSDIPNTSLFSGWTQEELRMAQESDPDIAPVKKWMDEGRGRLPYADIAHFSPATKSY